MAKKLIQVVYTVNDAALLKSAKTIEANEAAAKKADDQVKKFGKSASTAGNDASKSFLNLGTVWKSVIAIGIVSFITNLGKRTLELGIKQEQLNIAFKTFLGSAEKAKKLLGDLTKFSIVTPFSPDQVNNAAKALLAFGVQGKDIIPTLKMLGDVSSGTGKDLTEMAIIFGQIRSTGRLMGQDLLQLINAGFNPLQVISQQTGKSVKILKEEMEKGLITFDMVAGAFKTATTEGGLFFNLMEEQSKSIGGVLSTIEGNFDEFLKNLFEAQSGPMKDFVDMMEAASRGLLLFSLTQDQVIEKGNAMIKDDFKAKAKEYADSVGDVVVAEALLAQQAEQNILKLQELNSELARSDNFNQELYDSNLKAINQSKQQIIALTELAEARREERGEAATKQLQADTEAQIKREKEAKIKAAKELNERLKDLEEKFKDTKDPELEEETTDILTLSQREALEELGRIGDQRAAELKEQGDRELEIQHDIDLDQIAAEEDKQARIKRLKQQAFDFGLQLLGQALMASTEADDETFNREKGNFDRRLAAVGDNERARQEIEVEKAKFEEEQDAKAQVFADNQARKEKERQIKQMTIQMLMGSLKALTTAPVPNFALAALTTAAGLASIGIAKGIGFKDGGINIQGPGTTTSDSINARLSKGESVINAAATSKSLNLLTAINERRIDDRILQKASGKTISPQADSAAVVKAIERNKAPDYYKEGYFVNQVIRKGDTLKKHTRAKYMASA